MERVHFLDQPQATEHDGNGLGSHRIPGGEEGSDVDESMGKQTTDLAGFLCRVG